MRSQRLADMQKVPHPRQTDDDIITAEGVGRNDVGTDHLMDHKQRVEDVAADDDQSEIAYCYVMSEDHDQMNGPVSMRVYDK